MKNLLIAVLIGFAGIGVGYWQFLSEEKLYTESFMDPIDRMRAELGVDASMDETLRAPRAKIEVVGGKEFTFGKMLVGTKRSHDFVFKNVGNEPSRVEVLATTCKCTIGKLDNPVLKPGEETIVTLTWTPTAASPEFAQTARIRTDDPDDLEIKLTVKGEVSTSIAFVPGEMSLGDVASTDSIHRSVKLLSCFDEPLEISELTWNHASTVDKVKLSQVTRKLAPGEIPENADAKYLSEITLDAAPGLPLGPLNSSILIKTNVVSEPLELSVQGHIAGAVRIIGGLNYDDSKNLLTVGNVTTREKKTVKLSLGIKVKEGFEPQVEGVCLRPEGMIKIHVDMEHAIKRPNQWIVPVELEVPEGTAPVSLNGSNPTNFGKVEFRTNVEFSPVVPMYFTIDVADR